MSGWLQDKAAKEEISTESERWDYFPIDQRRTMVQIIPAAKEPFHR